jgi:hypothetical protein
MYRPNPVYLAPLEANDDEDARRIVAVRWPDDGC